MNSCCNKCGKTDCCGGCSAPCPKPCQFDIQADPYDSQTWWVNGEKIRVPKFAETCTSLSADFSNATLNYVGECETSSITGRQLGQLINLDDLRDVEAENPDSCSMLMWNPHCDYCADGCTKVSAAWEPYHIPDAGDCVMEPDSQGYYHILKKTDCGCITECKLPIVPNGLTSVNYVRDSVPDDPDFPWYYGCYNDTINLYLAKNAPQYFGKYALKVTVNYGVQTILSSHCKNVNFRSLLVPVVNGSSVNVTREASILQGFCGFSTSAPEIPWGSQALRGSFTFIVPKGKEAYLHHEWRYRTGSSFPGYYTNTTYDGKRVPDNIATQVNAIPWNASRLNALQVIIEPTNGSANYSPTVDAERQQLDAATDVYPPLS